MMLPGPTPTLTAMAGIVLLGAAAIGSQPLRRKAAAGAKGAAHA